MAEAADAVTPEQTPEAEIARDIVRRGFIVAPLWLMFTAAIWGFDGAISSAYALALVLLNFLAAATLLTWTARIGPGALMAAALGGFILRLAAITVAVLLVRNLSVFEPVPLGITIIVAHLGLLIWETRYVSLSLAHPGLAPGAVRNSGGIHT